jgi:hypothetical protein
MIDIPELARLYDEAHSRPSPGADGQRVPDQERLFGQAAEPKTWWPTPKSVSTIQDILDVRIPPTLLEFVRSSDCSGDWFASLGEDYDNPEHIIRVNADTQRTRRRVQGRWQNVMPRNLVPFTLGFDGDYDCLDVSRPGPLPGEFEICHWACPMTEGTDYHLDFPSYILSIILFRTEDASTRRKWPHLESIRERATALLARHEEDVLDAHYPKGG